jgi:hypothetical protein
MRKGYGIKCVRYVHFNNITDDDPHLDHHNCEMTMFFILKSRIIRHLIFHVLPCALWTAAAAFRPHNVRRLEEQDPLDAGSYNQPVS